VDRRTAQLLETLDGITAALLVELVGGPATESELLAAVDDGSQSTGNRRLHALKRVGVVTQEQGKDRAPGRLWTVLHPRETHDLLEALFALSDVVEAKDRARREQAKGKLRRARAARLGIRRVG
jgi:DNA-binding HxlR family transcriptional regulator